MRARPWLATACAVSLSLGPVVAPTASHAAPEEPARPTMTRFGWKATFNFYRATAGLAPLRASNAWSRGAQLHSRYMARNGIITHEESPSKPYYTSAGAAAGRSGNVILTSGLPQPESQRHLIERWMTAPFHAAAMIDPALTRTGFGTYEHPTGGGRVTQGATLDVIRGRSGSGARDVVVWPGEGMQVPLKRYSGNEWPNPLTSCEGFGSEAGLPVLALFPDDVRVKSASISSGGATLNSCVFDGYTYRAPKAADQSYARSILRSRNTVVLIPKQPLQDFARYTASITTTGDQTVTWSFTVGEVVPPTDARIEGAVISRAFQERTNFTVAWAATDTGSGIATYDVRWRRSPVNGRLGGFERWQTDIDRPSAPFEAEPGHTYCFSARATDRAGNRSEWGSERCTTMPLRPGQLDAEPLWAPVILGDHYAGSAVMSLLPGSTLSTGPVKARRIALIATRCPLCGAVEVLWNGDVLARIDLTASNLRNRDQIDVASFDRLRTGRVVVRVVTPDRPVIVEGLGIGRI